VRVFLYIYSMKYKIYKLIHRGIVVYVGKTKLTLHQRKSCGYRQNLSIQAIYKECDIILIEETDDVSRERYWVDYYKDTLLNKRNGDTGLSHKEVVKQWYESNKEKIKEHQKEYRESNKEKKKEQVKEWRDSNREHYNQYMREYRKKK
jgi:hypothetical protein